MSVEVPYSSSGFREVGDFIVQPVGSSGIVVYKHKQGTATTPILVRDCRASIHSGLWRRNILLHKDSPQESETNYPLVFYSNYLEKIGVVVEPDRITVNSNNFDETNPEKVNAYRDFLHNLETVIKEELPKYS